MRRDVGAHRPMRERRDRNAGNATPGPVSASTHRGSGGRLARDAAPPTGHGTRGGVLARSATPVPSRRRPAATPGRALRSYRAIAGSRRRFHHADPTGIRRSRLTTPCGAADRPSVAPTARARRHDPARPRHARQNRAGGEERDMPGRNRPRPAESGAWIGATTVDDSARLQDRTHLSRTERPDPRTRCGAPRRSATGWRTTYEAC